ncbi:hypothetical protein [Nocardia vinacea]|uniref:hypothetical protein n=1 Tax=Nocardia vinacea TaxID=96468 RepID=UPI0002D34C11|nr:hypothetical protein [Nocardia vinacea]
MDVVINRVEEFGFECELACAVVEFAAVSSELLYGSRKEAKLDAVRDGLGV